MKEKHKSRSLQVRGGSVDGKKHKSLGHVGFLLRTSRNFPTFVRRRFGEHAEARPAQ